MPLRITQQITIAGIGAAAGIIAATVGILPQILDRCNGPHVVSYEMKGYCWGYPYIYVDLYIDNPSNHHEPPQSQKNQIFTTRCNGANTKNQQVPIVVPIPEKYLTPGDHTVDLYVYFPGENPAGISMSMIKKINNELEIIHPPWVMEQEAVGIEYNYGSFQKFGHSPIYRYSFHFNIQ